MPTKKKPTPAKKAASPLTEREQELVAIGASIGGNCIPCLEWHYERCVELGLTRAQLAQAIDVAKIVKEVPNQKIYDTAKNLLRGTQTAKGKKTQGCKGGVCALPQ